MSNLFQEIRILRDEAKLHPALLKRTRILFIISVVLLLAVLYNIFFREVSLLIITLTVLLSLIGFLLGLYVFSHMNVVNWDEEKEILTSGKMDKLGYATLVLYIIFEISLRTFLKSYFPASVLPLLLSGIFGTLLGRAVGTLVEIHRVYLLNHSK